MTIKIILADDHQIVRQGLRTLLAGEPDIQVVGEADDGRKTLKLAQELAPDVIIMDISMPDLNGIEATRQLLVESPGVKVIALSMHSDSLFVSNMLRSGALGYLLKDCALEELVKAIRTVMRQQTYISPGVSDLLDPGSRLQLCRGTQFGLFRSHRAGAAGFTAPGRRQGYAANRRFPGSQQQDHRSPPQADREQTGPEQRG